MPTETTQDTTDHAASNDQGVVGRAKGHVRQLHTAAWAYARSHLVAGLDDDMGVLRQRMDCLENLTGLLHEKSAARETRLDAIEDRLKDQGPRFCTLVLPKPAARPKPAAKRAKPAKAQAKARTPRGRA